MDKMRYDALMEAIALNHTGLEKMQDDLRMIRETIPFTNERPFGKESLEIIVDMGHKAASTLNLEKIEEKYKKEKIT